MTPRDIVLEQIHHHETQPVPYTLAFEREVDERLDRHFGSADWRKRIVPYMAVRRRGLAAERRSTRRTTATPSARSGEPTRRPRSSSSRG